jgi:hypothetical protein
MSRSRILNLKAHSIDSDRDVSLQLLTPGNNEQDQTSTECNVPINLLIDHAIVTGGQSELRTEFCKKLVQSIAKTRVPILVLASNRAYRTLLEDPTEATQIVYYTLGQNIFPLAVNLFELPPNITVSSHIHRLANVFRKIYKLSKPAAYTVEKIFTAVYEKRGWNLLDNSNSRMTDEQSQTYQGDVYPYLAESLDVLDETIESCMLEENVKTDIKSNLQSILSDLTTGVNRGVFNTRSNSSVLALFQQRVVIETTSIRANQDRALYAAILLNFYEEIVEPSSGLKNVFVLDDCAQLGELFATTEDSDNNKAPTKVTFNLEALTAGGQCVVFSGIRGIQFESIDLAQTGLSAIFQERNTRAISKLGEFLSLNLTSLNVVKSFAPYEVLVLLDCDNSHTANLEVARLAKDKNLNIGVHETFNADKNSDVKNGSPGDLDSKVAGDDADKSNDNSGNDIEIKKSRLFAMDHTLLRAQTQGISDEQLEQLNLHVERVNRPLAQKGVSYFPEAFTVDSLAISEKLLQNKSFYGVFVRYIASFTKDLTQLVHFRAQLIHEIQRLTGRKTAEFLRKISWCSISFSSERYFGAKALINHWSLDEEREMLKGWFELMAPAFVPDAVNPNLQRRLDISQVRGWRDQFLQLQATEQGPFPACGACTSKCLVGYDVSQFLSEQGLFFDFNSAISRRDAAASDSSAWYVRLLCERLIGQFDIDLAYCLAIHFIKTQRLSTDAQLVLLQKVRQHLQLVGQGTDSNQIDRGKKGDEVRVIQFPKMMKE